MQVKAASKERKQRTLAALQGVKGKVGVDLISVALKGKKLFRADLDESRSTKQGGWDSRRKLRTEEILAIVDTIKILNEDEDEQLWADLDESRSTKQGEWNTRCKFRTEEILAILDTIKILIEDEALEVFGKTLPGVASRCRSRPPPRRGSRGLLQRCRA